MEALDVRANVAVQLSSQIVCGLTARSSNHWRKVPTTDWVLIVNQRPSAGLVESPLGSSASSFCLVLKQWAKLTGWGSRIPHVNIQREGLCHPP